jgi:MFS transporter, UMF1 family
MTEPASRLGQFSWALYDWANSAFSVVIVTFVFATYFSQGIASDPVTGTSQWAAAMSSSAVGVILLAPVLGAVADAGGRRKVWLALFTSLTVAGCCALWFAEPDTRFVLYTLAVVVLANVCFEMCGVFYNAMLPEITSEDRIGRLSGWAWSLGYFGGIVCLAAVLLLFVQTDEPLFGLDRERAEEVRVAGPFVAVWFALFAIPLFLFTPDKPRTGISIAEAAREGLRKINQTVRRFRDYWNIGHFLVARMIYTEGLNTLFTFGGIYAAGTFGMPLSEVILFGIVLNISAGVGALAFGWLDDRIGPKRTILLALVGLIGFGVVALVAESTTVFWVAGTALGVFVGPAQAASRSFLARLAPEELRTEMFGIYALTGKMTAFLGPAALGFATWASGSQRIGMSTIVLFYIAGMALLWGVREPERGAPRRGGAG